MIITPGMRAMSVAVDEVGDISGFVKPHTHVDVLVAISGTGADNNKPYSKIVLQNIEVIAVEQQIDKGKDEAEVAKVVTLLVTPHDAEKLGLAGREGTLRLAMRNYNDDKLVPTAGSDFADLLGARVAPGIAINTQPSSMLAAARVAARVRAAIPSRWRSCATERAAETVSFISASANGISNSIHQDAPMAAPAAPPTSNRARGIRCFQRCCDRHCGKLHPLRQRAIGIFSARAENSGGAVSDFLAGGKHAEHNEIQKLS